MRGAVNILGAWSSGRVLNDETYLSVGGRWVFFVFEVEVLAAVRRSLIWV